MNDGTCSVEACTGEAHCRGWCKAHHTRWLKFGDLQIHIPIMRKRPRGTAGACTAGDCQMPAKSRYCAGHAGRLRTWGELRLDVPLRSKHLPPPICSMDGCPNLARGQGLCSGHYTRLIRKGAVGATELRILNRYEPGQSCAVKGCPSNGRLFRGWCKVHYQRWKRTGSVSADVPIRPEARDLPIRLCDIDGCGEIHYGNGLCPVHYQRWYKRGDVQADRPRAANRHVPRACLIDDCEEAHFSLGYCTRHYMALKNHGDPLGGKSQRPQARRYRHLPPADRFWKFVDKAGPVPDLRPDLGPCWIWIGTRYESGYGSSGLFRGGPGGSTAHRIAWHLVGRPLIDGMVLDHLCAVKPCVNPDHLEQVTGAENSRRGIDVWVSGGRRRYCPSRHELTPENTGVGRKGGWKCLTCGAEELYRYQHIAATTTRLDRQIIRDYRQVIRGEPCRYCGEPSACADHYYPISKGSTDVWHHIVPACRSCNAVKADRCGTWFMLRGGRTRRSDRPVSW